MKRLSVLAATAAIFVMLASTATALDRRGPDGKPGRDGFMGLRGDVGSMTSPSMSKACKTPEFYLRKASKIGLTDEQIDRMEALYYDLKRTMIEKGARVKVLELELTEIVSRPDFDLGKAKSVMEKVESARTDLRESVLESAAAARDILTPEQLDTVRSMRKSPVNNKPYMKRDRRKDMGRDATGMDEDAIRRKIERKMRERMGAPADMSDMMDESTDEDY